MSKHFSTFYFNQRWKNALSDEKSEYDEHTVWAEKWSLWAITAHFSQSGQFLEDLLQKIVLHLSFNGAQKYMTKAEQNHISQGFS